jgi:hypothetical protein
MTTANAVTRETDWLTTFGDGLPALLAADGGPWDVIQAYMPRVPIAQKTQIYVMRRKLATSRFSQQRRIATYSFHLSCVWPIGASSAGAGIAETEQQNLDMAIDLLIARIEDSVTDHSHGGRFLSVAETPTGSAAIEVDYQDPAQTIPTGFLLAAVTYSADDGDYTA